MPIAMKEALLEHAKPIPLSDTERTFSIASPAQIPA
jgi:hypothetical protein